MRIILDPQIFYKQKFGGISRYFTEVYKRLKTSNAISIHCPLFISTNLHLEHYGLQPKGPRVLLLRILNKVMFWSRMFAKNKQYANFLLRRKKADVFVPTYYDPYFLEACATTPFVLTVFDMIHELFPQHIDDKKTVRNKQLLMEKATAIIAISHSTKNDILKLYPQIASEKIKVVYLCHSVDPSHLTSAIISAKQYLLFVGRRGAYKNFTFFIKSTAAWLIKNDMELYCLGGGRFDEQEMELLLALGVKERVKQVTFDDDELGDYYSGAFAFVFPSEYEGFGIPVLEAMACGCPVVLPPVSSFPEVAGEAGIYFDVNSGSSLLDRLQSLADDIDFRQQKIALGLLQEKKFSWERTTAECLKVYENAIR
jgi:glycosyltransferase involved in cell wall biosynthesis